jgi:hypothetical protein
VERLKKKTTEFVDGAVSGLPSIVRVMRLGNLSSSTNSTNDESGFITLILKKANNKAKEYMKEQATSKYFILMYF